MRGDGVRRLAGAVVALGVLVAGATGCGDGTVEPVTTDAWVEGGLPEYCAGHDGADADFWEAVHSSCAVAQDGDRAQADALGRVLSDLDTDDVERFQRTMVRLNRGLRGIAPFADEICLPGLGLGQDLGTDYRSWVIAHGQAVYEALLADPDRLRDLPDARNGCGLGEPFGAAGFALYLERTGRSPSEAGRLGL